MSVVIAIPILLLVPVIVFASIPWIIYLIEKSKYNPIKLLFKYFNWCDIKIKKLKEQNNE